MRKTRAYNQLGLWLSQELNKRNLSKSEFAVLILSLIHIYRTVKGGYQNVSFGPSQHIGILPEVPHRIGTRSRCV